MKNPKTLKTLIWTNIISLLVFIFILLEVFHNGFLIKLDLLINSFMPNIENSLLTNLSIAISFIFDIKSLAVITLILSFYLLLKNSKKDSIFFILTIIFGGEFIYIIKDLIQRTRPLNALVSESDFAFPSGHAAISIAFFGILIYLFSQKRGLRSLKLVSVLISIFIILLICFSRVYLNVHWFSDVLGGIAIGTFILTGCILLKEFFIKK